MFLKQYAYKPRTMSQSSGTSDSGAADSNAQANTAAATKTDTATTANTAAGPVSGAIAGRRRSSDLGKFAGLQSHKRGAGDEGAAARKASFSEQKPGQTGLLGGMWNSFTKGS